ncbi:MAG: DUF262 domain-containing protein [Ignavibacteria bacterium]|nr:DUF262 domain-containing protein [Ignavibacteria bacterium]
MKFITKEISIKELISLFEDEKLFLDPPYQRKEIWPMSSKKLLIDSIIKGLSLPNFFFLESDNGVYEVVDGQQRIRTIINFYKGLFPYEKKDFYDKNKFPMFLDFKLVLVILKKTDNSEVIEDFYTRVNSTGMKLNRPELKKAEFYNTRFLNLIETLASNDKFISLELFTEKSLVRMNDIDFTSELVSLIKNGITDKKDAVDRMFEKDVSSSEYEQLLNEFVSVLEILVTLNKIYAVSETRYKQKNDFYTLFGFLHLNKDLPNDMITYFYKVLVLIDEDIKPSNEECTAFYEYALNCVSQSNSKNAREQRLKFYDDLFLNNTHEINNTQRDVLNYYNLPKDAMINIGEYYTISGESIQSATKEPKVF